MGAKGQNTTTQNSASTSTYTPNPAAAAAYNALLSRAGNVANLPYTAYSGELVAPVNAQQNLGIGNINANAGFAAPYIQQASQYANQAASPITAQQINQYLDPYTQQVVNATQAQFANQNAQQQNQLIGNAAAQNALGGDRVAVAQAQLAGQQNLAQAPIIAGLYSKGYGQALQTALAEQQNLANAAYSLGNLGVAGQQAALQGAGAQIGAGTLEQQTQQALDQALYGQFVNAQAFPYQQTSWLAGLTGGVAPLMGGTTVGYGQNQTTKPGPNPWNTVLGLGAAGLGAYFGGPWGAAAGAKAANAATGEADGGAVVRGFDDGGGVAGVPYGAVAPMPYAAGVGYIPQMAMRPAQPPQMTPFSMPQAPEMRQDQSALDIVKNAADIAKVFRGAGVGRSQSQPIHSPSEDAIYRRGGFVRGFADGGEPLYEARNFPTMAGFGPGSIVPDDYDLYAPKADAWPPPAGVAPPRNDFAPTGPMTDSRMMFADELANPRVRERLMRLTEAEVGGQGPAASAAFMESVFNRAGSRGQTLTEAMNDAGYYPRVSLAGRTPSDRGGYARVLDAVMGGSNLANYATGNASGGVGFNGGPQTYSPGTGERFGVEGPDMRWARAQGFAPEGPSVADTADLPPEITAGVSRREPMAYAAPAGVASRERPDASAGSGNGVSPWMALMSAGLGIAASSSPYLGQAIGEGGLQGLKQYAADVGQAQSQRRIDLEARRLQEAADRAKQRLQYQKDTLAETQEQHKFERTQPKTVGYYIDKYGIRQPIMGVQDKNGNWVDPITRKPLNESAPISAPSSTAPPANTAPAPPSTAPSVERPTGSSRMPVSGEVPEHVAWLADGPFDYAQGDKIPREIPKGSVIPPPQPVHGIDNVTSPASIEQMAESYLLRGDSALPKASPGKSPIAVSQQKVRAAVLNYGNALAAARGFAPGELAQMWQFAPKLAQWIVGRDGQTAVSLGTAYRHLNLLQELGDAYYNKRSDTEFSQTWNRIRGKIAAQFGDKDISAANAAAQYSGGEIVKAIVGVGGGGVGERLANEENFRIGSGLTKDQFHANIAAAKAFIAEQLQGKENMSKTLGMSSDRFHTMIGDDAYAGLKESHKPAAGGAAGAATTWTDPKTQKTYKVINGMLYPQ